MVRGAAELKRVLFSSGGRGLGMDMLLRAVERRGWTSRRGRRSVAWSPEDIPRWDEEHMASSETGKQVWRKEERKGGFR